MPLYHFAPIRLGPGSVILPGNWGRQMLAMQQVFKAGDGTPMTTANVAREFLFETIRLRSFPGLPSRLDCCFVCPTEDDAKAYAQRANKNGTQALHVVEVVDPRAKTHTAHVGNCEHTESGLYLPTMVGRGTAYWEGTQSDPASEREMLIAGEIRVVSSVS